MGIFFVYILKSSVCLTIFYLFYKLLLSRDTFHRFNRIALLSLIMLSVIIPFCEITLEEATAIQRPVMDLENLLAAVSMRTSAESASQPVWLRVSLYNRRDINALSIRIFILCLVPVDETRYTEAGGRNPSDSYGPTSRPVQLDANDRNKPEGF